VAGGFGIGVDEALEARGERLEKGHPHSFAGHRCQVVTSAWAAGQRAGGDFAPRAPACDDGAMEGMPRDEPEDE
jgi:hypothetical protein